MGREFDLDDPRGSSEVVAERARASGLFSTKKSDNAERHRAICDIRGPPPGGVARKA